VIHPVYIALGSNLGDRLDNLRTAVRDLFPRAPVCRVSNIYQTPPWGYLDQPYFLNMVVEAQTSLTPRELLDYLRTLESQMGREKTIVNGPRTIDMDILFYGNQIYNDEELTIPHPRMRGRGFVMLPLADLTTTYIHPVFRLRIAGMLKECDLLEIQPFSSAADFEVSLSDERMLMPVEATLALKGNEQAARIFHSLPPSHQQEHLRYIAEARKAETRHRRASRMLETLLRDGQTQ